MAHDGATKPLPAGELPQQEGDFGYLGTPEWDVRPSQPMKLTNPLHTLKDEFVFVQLGAIYECCCLNFSLTEQFFRQLNDDTTNFFYVKFGQPIVSGMWNWGSILECIPKQLEENLLSFMLAQAFLRRDQKEFWRVEAQEVKILDPTVQAGCAVMSILAFLPSGNTKRAVWVPPEGLGLVQGAVGTIDWEPPRPYIVQEAEAALVLT